MPTATTEPSTTTLNPAGRALLFVLSGTMLLDALEVSTAAVTLPAVGDDLGLPPASSHWLISGFALAFGGLILVAGRAVARVGSRRPYLLALLVFAAASVTGGLAGDGPLLMATRVIKGACAAFTAPVGLAIIAAAFPEGTARTRAMSVYALFGAGGFTCGLVVSGVLTTVLGWRWTLAAPAPAALVLFLAGLRLVPRDAGVPGGAQAGRTDRKRSGQGDGGVLARGRLIRSCLGAATLNGSFWGLLLVGSLHLQAVAGWTALQTALAFVPATVLLLLSVPYSGRLAERYGPARLIAIGAAAPPAGYALLLRLDGTPSYLVDILPTVLLVGAGYVLCFAALHIQATAGVPESRKGPVSGVYQSSVQLGGALAVWLTALALPATSAHGHHAAIGLITAVGTLGFLAALAGVIGRRPDRPERSARNDEGSDHDDAGGGSPLSLRSAGVGTAERGPRGPRGQPSRHGRHDRQGRAHRGGRG
ncbi:MFS transporter [Actinomadura sp. 7K507]|uniref:MFS transporter n=1 Tax=Actinomadura sp. 7K507 TaxID=2530365 RepID=UPI001A9DCF7F|nr:MFS transporter [Actinomadura sp. 7K507]